MLNRPWKNKATQIIAKRHEDLLIDWSGEDWRRGLIASQVKSVIMQVEGVDKISDGIAKDLILSFMDKVDWKQIAARFSA